MQTEEKILLALATVALVAVLVFKFRPDMLPAADTTISAQPDVNIVGQSVNQFTSDPDTGPWYLKFNMPYLFGPPVSFMTPPVTEGQVGQSDVNTVENMYYPSDQWKGTLQ